VSVPERSDDVLIAVHDGIGHITLNRPRTINALTHGMVTRISAVLTGWYGDDSVGMVLIDGAGDRGLCAGGDIRAIYEDARTGGSSSIDFWRDEYRLNALIARYPKPVIAIMDGLVMGGGVGLSAHASHRIVTERTVLAMPEVNIGLVPDVGGSYLLARSPGWLGLHAALTGIRLGAADVIALGLADHYIEHTDLADFVQTLAVHGVNSATFRFVATPPGGAILGQQTWIDSCYGADTASEIVARLEVAQQDAAMDAARAIRSASPTSVAVTLRAIRNVRAAGLSLEQALNQEFRNVCAALRSPDLVEGIRAQVIDKDRNPKWEPQSIDAVSEDLVDAYFALVTDSPFPHADDLVTSEH
jgi:enoyl-CoA hydratase